MEEQNRDIIRQEEGRENASADIPDISQNAGAGDGIPAETKDEREVHVTAQDQPVNQSVPYPSGGQPSPGGPYYNSQPSGYPVQQTGYQQSGQYGPNQQYLGQQTLQNGIPGQYVQPKYGAPQPQASNGFAVASMVLGIVSIALCSLYFLAPICAVVGLVLGCVYKGKGGKSGLATAGIICSSIGLAIGVILICLIMIGIGLAAYY